MATSLPSPPAIAAPFASLDSARNEIPALTQITSGGATLQQGFPPECSVPISNGGVPPSRLDMNGMGYIATFPQYYLQQGGFYTYDPNVASAIGGYPQGAVLTYYDSANKVVRKLRSTVPNNSANFIDSPSVIGSQWADVTPVIQTGRRYFDVFYSLREDAPYGAVELNGAVLSSAGYPGFYEAAVSASSAGTIPTVTSAAYASQVAAYGQCGAFIVNTAARTVTIPTLNGFIQAVSSGGGTGKLHSAGLPNVTGTLGEVTFTPSNIGSGAAGAFRRGPAASGSVGSQFYDDYENGGSHPVYSATFDASRSNAVYGKADTVQPRSVEMRLYMQVVEGNAAGGSGGGSGGGVTPGEVLDIVAQSGGYISSSGGYIATAASGGTVATQVFSGGGYTYTALAATRSATCTVTDSGFTLLAGSSGADGWYTSASFEASDSAWIVNDVGNGNRAMLALSGLHRAALVESNLQSGRYSEVIASSNGAALYFDDGVNTAFVSAHSGGVTIYYYDMNAMESQTLTLASGGAYLNGVPLGMATVSDTTATSAYIPILSGGTCYKYGQPLIVLSIGAIADTPAEDYIRFTLAAGGSVTVPASVAVLNSGLEFEGGKEYLVAFNGGMMVAAEVTPGA